MTVPTKNKSAFVRSGTAVEATSASDVARQAEMDRDDAKEMAALHAEEKKRKEAEAEQMEWAIAIVIIVMFVGTITADVTSINIAVVTPSIHDTAS